MRQRWGWIVDTYMKIEIVVERAVEREVEIEIELEIKLPCYNTFQKPGMASDDTGEDTLKIGTGFVKTN